MNITFKRVAATRVSLLSTNIAGGERNTAMSNGSGTFIVIDVEGLGEEAVIVRRHPVGLLLIGSAMSCEDRIDIMEQAMAETVT